MPNFARRTLLACGLSLIALAGASHAQALPPTIKLVVPYPPGGSADTLARLIAQPLQEQLKATVVVDNRPGAGGRIAASQVKRSPADGSVILIAPNALTTIQSLVYAGQLDYKRDGRLHSAVAPVELSDRPRGAGHQPLQDSTRTRGGDEGLEGRELRDLGRRRSGALRRAGIRQDDRHRVDARGLQGRCTAGHRSDRRPSAGGNRRAGRPDRAPARRQDPRARHLQRPALFAGTG